MSRMLSLPWLSLGYIFAEVGYCSLNYRDVGHRSLSYFNAAYDAHKNKDYMVYRCWNEFSSTDELPAQAFTVEPNTQLYKYDGTPGGTDPWYYYNAVKAKFNQ